MKPNKSNLFQEKGYNNANHGSYGVALFDPKWKLKRKEILERDGNCCKICNSEEELQVHHRQYHFIIYLNTYKNPWEYDNKLLVTLCKACHQKGHRMYKVPTIKINTITKL